MQMIEHIQNNKIRHSIIGGSNDHWREMKKSVYCHRNDQSEMFVYKRLFYNRQAGFLSKRLGLLCDPTKHTHTHIHKRIEDISNWKWDSNETESLYYLL